MSQSRMNRHPLSTGRPPRNRVQRNAGRRTAWLVTALLAGVLFAIGLTGTSARAGDVYYLKAFGAWTVACEREGRRQNCTLTASASNGPLAVGLSIVKPVRGDAAVGVGLAAYDFANAEVGIQIDQTTPTTTRPQTTKAAIFAPAASGALIDGFAAGRWALVYFTLHPSGQRQAVRVSLAGFQRALDAYTAQLFLIEPTGTG